MVRAEPNLECRGEEPLNIKFEICEHDGEPTLVSGSAAAVSKKFGHPEMFQPQEGMIATVPTVDPQIIPISTYSDLRNWDGRGIW